MRVRIHNLPEINSDADPVVYIATCEDDCRDNVDKMVFQLVECHCDVITMGKTIGEPIK